MMRRARVFSVTVLLGALAPCQGPVMGDSVDLLDFRVTDAEFSAQLGRIVAISSTPTNQLHIYDPVARSAVSIDLPLAGTCVSVGPDGKKAVVGHSAWITYVDLETPAIIDTLAVSTNVGDIVLAGNGYAYGFPDSQGTKIYCVELATGVESLGTGRNIGTGTRAKLHPDGAKMYGAYTRTIPSDIERYDISQGTASYDNDSPYHGDFPMLGDLWISEDGLRIFVRGGVAFRSSDVRSEDMVFNGLLGQLSQVKWLDHSSEAGKVLVVPDEPRFGVGPGRDTELQVYDYRFLTFDGSYDFPQVELGGKKHDTHGLLVFFEADGLRAWAIVEVDPASALLFDHGIVEFQLDPESDPLSTDTDKVSISNGGTQTFSLDAGPAHGGRPYLLLGSINGALPGIPLGSVVLPLNFEPLYFLYTVAGPNRWPLSNSFGTLDSQGRATASFGLAANQVSLSLEGLILHHAFLVAGSTGLPVFSSNAVKLRLIH